MAWVIERSKHGGSPLLVLLMIANYCHTDGRGAEIPIGELARDCRMSPRAVQYIVTGKLLPSGELVCHARKRGIQGQSDNRFEIPGVIRDSYHLRGRPPARDANFASPQGTRSGKDCVTGDERAFASRVTKELLHDNNPILVSENLKPTTPLPPPPSGGGTSPRRLSATQREAAVGQGPEVACSTLPPGFHWDETFPDTVICGRCERSMQPSRAVMKHHRCR